MNKKQFRRISKREAKKRFFEGKPIYLCPCKMVPYTPFNQAVLVFPGHYIERAKTFPKSHILWKGSVNETAWSIMYNNWAWYNISYEAGYYAHYYEPTTDTNNTNT